MNAGGLPVFGAHAPPLDPRAVARAILAEPRFARAHNAPAQETWWDRVLHWLGDEWDRLARALSHSVHIGTGTSVAAGDLIIAASAALVIVVLVRLLSQYVRQGAARAGAVPVSGKDSARKLYRQSLAAASSGRYAEAVTLLFRAALAALDVRGVVHDDPSFTVNECRREVGRAEPHFAAPFDALARIFSDVLYADAPVGPQTWNEALRAYAQIVQESSDAA